MAESTPPTGGLPVTTTRWSPGHENATVDTNESYPELAFRAVAVIAALDELDVRPDDRVLIMLPDGPGRPEALASVIRRGAVPLPVNPLLPTDDVTAVAVDRGAQLVLTSVDRIQALADLDADPPVLVNGPQGIWAAVLRLH